MNVRRSADYSGLFLSVDKLMRNDLPQTELYFRIGQLVCDRPEKGAAVAVAEYLQSAYPEASGFSPRNLRRMRDFAHAYNDKPQLLADALNVGWTLNVVMQYRELREWLGRDDLDLAAFDLDEINFRLKKIPRIYADIYEYGIEPSEYSLKLLERKTK